MVSILSGPWLSKHLLSMVVWCAQTWCGDRYPCASGVVNKQETVWQEIGDFMRPRWENDCQVVLPCRGIWENKALHKPFLFFFSAKQKLAGHCWLFLWRLYLFSAAVIIRGIEMDLSAPRVCWMAWLCTGQRTSYSWEGLRRNNRLYLTKNSHIWRLTVTYTCTNDPQRKAHADTTASLSTFCVFLGALKPCSLMVLTSASSSL